LFKRRASRIADSTSGKDANLIRSPNETFSVVAMCVCNPGRFPIAIHGCNTTPTPTGFAEIVGDYLHNASSCRAYADEEFGPETLQMQAFRLHY